MDTLAGLQHRIGYQFKDVELLTQALTHRSRGGDHNERLEFLGDAILGYAIARILFQRFAEATEGQLSRLRATLVRRQTLAEIAREFDLGDCLIMGKGELKSGGPNRESILADGLEAIIGALFLDGGLEVTEPLLETWFADRLSELTLNQTGKDAKSRLQEFLQSIGSPLPRYEVVATHGRSHDQMFVVECHSEKLPESVSGTGKSRRMAEQEAAIVALRVLGIDADE